eukprot:1262562-Amphidinium_carterae.1
MTGPRSGRSLAGVLDCHQRCGCCQLDCHHQRGLVGYWHHLSRAMINCRSNINVQEFNSAKLWNIFNVVRIHEFALS